MLISEITIGDRARKDMGDLRSLADSIERHGLLHPVVVMKDGTLVAGQRRIEAVKLLGGVEIPATVVDVADLLAAERDENTERKDFLPSEGVALGRLIEMRHRARIAAQKSEMARRNVAMRKDRPTSARNEEVVTPLGTTDDVASRAVGMDSSTYFRAKKVVAAAEAEPEKYGDLPAVMDETGNVSGTYRELERRKSDGSVGRLPINRKTALPNADREIERLALSLEGIALAAGALDMRAVTKGKAEEWEPSIRRSVGALRKLLANLKGVSE